MNNENKPLMSPDRVLSMVVLVLSMFMILGIASLSYVQEKMERSTAMIIMTSNQAMDNQLGAQRQQALSSEEEGSETEEDEKDIVEE